ncbi:multidrug resistance efflux transporter family protein [Siminovitchia fortis]|uniref:Multidrug resistance efflux transporter family protein n=1 Tax=Siminovitchia fortis TaxID=254758 RepID=A0A443IYR7_9BACI|nr:multidrug resistance efflux transporter family protein [Siminovitchia fortis]RWR13193.1 multidrug resistance efflux transporter family protein [Siminovitchia fortis]WHY82024.1 multidrug resistance efflux transporter family protein [Siminovitchia fortis]
MRPILLGVVAAFFFAFTFIFNRAMDLSGGSWIWSASLRYIFMVPFLLVIVMVRGNFRRLIQEMKANPGEWLLWSTVGFGLFYAPLTFAAGYGPGWLIASTFQITIISGSLLAPLFYETIQTSSGRISVRGKIPYRGLAMSLIILVGIAMMQLEHMNGLSLKNVLFCVIPIIVASFAYPLGNRKMMGVCGGRLDTYQRVLGMTLGSMPFWLVLAGWELATGSLPSQEQTFQSLLVAISSGVIATVLFFKATDSVKDNMGKLAAVEATQSLEVPYALLGEIVVLSAPMPDPASLIGMMLVVAGMVLHSYVSRAKEMRSATQ